MKLHSLVAAATFAFLASAASLAGCTDTTTSPTPGNDTGPAGDVGDVGGLDGPDAGGDAATVPDTATVDTAIPTDVATDTGAPQDIQADTGPTDTGGTEDVPDVAADVTEDAGIDIAEDTGPDIVLPPPAEDQAFRVDEMTLLAPNMCYDLNGDGTCDPVNFAVNAIVSGELDDPDEPLDVVGIMSPFEVPTDSATLALGAATCVRTPGGGVHDIESCTLLDDETNTPAYFDKVTTNESGGCNATPLILAPCFVTNSQQSLTLNLLDIPFTFLEAKLAGQFINPGSFNGITNGYIKGFMPVTTAAGVQVDVGGNYVKLTELLKEAPKSTVGEKTGWKFEFSFEASRIPLDTAP